MQSQRQLLKLYRAHYGDLSFREIALQTGIQQTRVFRIFNGSEMKLGEFETFKRLITIKTASHTQLALLFEEACQKLSVQALREIELGLKRKIELWNLINETANAKAA